MTPSYQILPPRFTNRHRPMDPADSRHLPLLNLSKIRSRISHVQRFLSDSLITNTIIPDAQMNLVSNEITAAINDLIVNGSALISSSSLPVSNSRTPNLSSPLTFSEPHLNFNNSKEETDLGFPKTEVFDEQIGGNQDIVEIDAVELLAEHLHFCDFCGKGFKRDANLRMHMRAHGNKFKTLEALSKPPGKSLPDSESTGVRRTRFSCPFTGCSRNKLHKKFRPLKSVICVKNHFKRSHCPKMFSCNICHKKSFSVLADLKSHLKHCGETRWKCSCGTSFSRKDKLFGHIALFEGHMPAMPAAEDDVKAKEAVVLTPQVVESADVKGIEWVDDDDDGMLFGGLGSVDDDFCLQDLLGAGSDWNL